MVKVGDLVLIKAGSEKFVRNEKIATRGIVLSQIDDDWFRIYISWSNKTRTIDLPSWMLENIKKE